MITLLTLPVRVLVLVAVSPVAVYILFIKGAK